MAQYNDSMKRRSALLSIIGLVIGLTVARGLDALMVVLGHRMSVYFSLQLALTILWVQSVAMLLLAALVLLLFWYAAVRAPRSAWVAVLYLAVGLFLAFYPQLYYWPLIASWMPGFLTTLMDSPALYTVHTGALVAITGLFMLALPRR